MHHNRTGLFLGLVTAALLAGCASTPPPAPVHAAVKAIKVETLPDWSAYKPAPTPVVAVAPVAPRGMDKAGTAKVSFMVDRAGRVSEITLLTGAEFAPAIVPALDRWRFGATPGGPYRLLFSFTPPNKFTWE